MPSLLLYAASRTFGLAWRHARHFMGSRRVRRWRSGFFHSCSFVFSVSFVFQSFAFSPHDPSIAPENTAR
jgi:hypothetical protein